jgi:hypothetical protein
VAEGDLLMADAAPTTCFVPTLHEGLTVAGMPHVGVGFADVGRRTGVFGHSDAPAATARIANVVQGRSTRLLNDWGIHGRFLGLLYRRFGKDRGFGGILAVSWRVFCARWGARLWILHHGSLEGCPLRCGRSERVVAVRPTGEDSAFLGNGHAGYCQQEYYEGCKDDRPLHG